MKPSSRSLLKRLGSLVAFSFLLSQPMFADTIDARDVDELDIGAIRDWVNNKRQVTLKEIGGDLSISGEIRTEYQTTSEVRKGIQQRGWMNADLPRNEFDVEFNLMLDYRADRSWAALKLEFDNDAGVVGGSLNKLKLEKGYLGVRLLKGNAVNIDLEVGRRRLSTVFDSKVEFAAFMDGMLLRYDQSFLGIADFYVHVGTLVVNQRWTQFAYVGELGLMNIGNSGAFMKYSVIDWDTKDNIGTSADFGDPIPRRYYQFIVNQLLLGYKFQNIFGLTKVWQVYAAGLYNPVAHGHRVTGGKKAAWASYIGFSVGQLKQSRDWAFDANYQWVSAQAVPSFDASGIGNGSIFQGFYTKNINGTGELLTDPSEAGGNTNFKGFQMTLDYMLTNNLTFQQVWQQSVALDHKIGPQQRFKQYEIELIYAF